MPGQPIEPVCTEPKVFVGQIPVEASEADVRNLFEKYGTIQSCTVINGPAGRSKGCAMVVFQRWGDAEAAVEGENGTQNLGGARALVVKFADPPKKDGPTVGIAPKKLFIGQVPGNTSEQQMREMFAPYGNIVDLHVMQKPGMGCAFITYSRWAEAESAIAAWDGKITMDGAKAPMVVKFADAKVEPKMQGEKRLLSPEAMQNPAKRTFTGAPGPMGMGSNFGGGYGGGYGGGMNQFGGGGMNMMNDGMNMGPGGYGGMDNSGYGGMDHRGGGGGFGGMDHRGGGFGGMDHRGGGGFGGMDHRGGGGFGGMGGGPGNMHHMGGPMDMGGPMGGSGSFGGMGGGPKGMGAGGPMSLAEEAKQWKLFIGQVPFDATEQDLWPFFCQIGPILELVILRNPQGQSKGCAFVTYESRQLAEQCIRQLDGQIQLPKDQRGKKLNIKWSGGDSSMQGVQPAPKISSNISEIESSKAWKLFIGQVPFNASESELWPYFSAIGNILELVILRGPTGESKGCAFLTYSDKQSAEACISQLDGRLVLPNDTRGRPLQIKFSAAAGGEVGGGHQAQGTSNTGGPKNINPQHSMTANRLGTGIVSEEAKRWKLFIGQVPFTATEVDLWPYFAQIGTIAELVVLRSPEGASKGCAFCTYDGRELADMAVQTLNNRIVLPGDIRNKPLSVRYADPSLN